MLVIIDQFSESPGSIFVSTREKNKNSKDFDKIFNQKLNDHYNKVKKTMDILHGHNVSYYADGWSLMIDGDEPICSELINSGLATIYKAKEIDDVDFLTDVTDNMGECEEKIFEEKKQIVTELIGSDDSDSDDDSIDNIMEEVNSNAHIFTDDSDVE
jgi:hypothetical protein